MHATLGRTGLAAPPLSSPAPRRTPLRPPRAVAGAAGGLTSDALPELTSTVTTGQAQQIGRGEGLAAPRQATRVRPSRRPAPVPDGTDPPLSDGRPRQHDAGGDPIPRDAYPRGTRVTGRVVAVGPAGAKVALLEDEDVIGFCKADELGRSPAAPGRADGAGGPPAPPPHLSPADALAIGDVREFVVRYTPATARKRGLGPVLSARAADEDVLWSRAAAAAAACAADGDAIVTTVVGVNGGGLLAEFAGLPAFVPFSQVDAHHVVPAGAADPGAPGPRRRLDAAAAAAAVGATLRAIPTDVDRVKSRIILSARVAAAAAARDALGRVGGLVWGTVSKVEPFGAFVRVDGTTQTALLHISNISRTRVPAVGAVFAPGDRVRALVVGMERDGSRVSLSTAEIEAADGDMLTDPARVYEGADDQAAVFRAHLDALAAAGEGGGQSESEGDGGAADDGWF